MSSGLQLLLSSVRRSGLDGIGTDGRSRSILRGSIGSITPIAPSRLGSMIRCAGGVPPIRPPRSSISSGTSSHRPPCATSREAAAASSGPSGRQSVARRWYRPTKAAAAGSHAKSWTCCQVKAEERNTNDNAKAQTTDHHHASNECRTESLGAKVSVTQCNSASNTACHVEVTPRDEKSAPGQQASRNQTLREQAASSGDEGCAAAPCANACRRTKSCKARSAQQGGAPVGTSAEMLVSQNTSKGD